MSDVSDQWCRQQAQQLLQRISLTKQNPIILDNTLVYWSLYFHAKAGLEQLHNIFFNIHVCFQLLYKSLCNCFPQLKQHTRGCSWLDRKIKDKKWKNCPESTMARDWKNKNKQDKLKAKDKETTALGQCLIGKFVLWDILPPHFCFYFHRCHVTNNHLEEQL